jgi:hypothetical protein
MLVKSSSILAGVYTIDILSPVSSSHQLYVSPVSTTIAGVIATNKGLKDVNTYASL